MKQVNIRIEDTLYEEYREQAYKCGIPVSVFVRDLLTKKPAMASVAPGDIKIAVLVAVKRAKAQWEATLSMTEDAFLSAVTNPDTKRPGLPQIMTLLRTRPVLIAEPAVSEESEPEDNNEEITPQ